jgi:hypothetical protein
MAKPRPKTGERRQVRQPLLIDLMPPDVHEAIKELRNDYNLVWAEIERLSALPYGKGWGSELGKYGFVDWDGLPARVLEKFPKRILSKRNLLRWFDIRESQNIEELDHDRRTALKFTRAYLKRGGIEGLDNAAINAASDQVFLMLRKVKGQQRENPAKYMLALADITQEARKNDIRQRVAETGEGRLKLSEDKWNAAKKKTEALAGEIESAVAEGRQPDLKDLAAKVREVYGA